VDTVQGRRSATSSWVGYIGSWSPLSAVSRWSTDSVQPENQDNANA